MERRKTFTMNWEGLADDDDDDDRFFETFDRISSATPLDLASSDDEDDEFEDSRMSFASTVSSMHPHQFRNFPNSAASTAGPMSPDYNVWMMAPGSINERRMRLLQDMGLNKNKELVSFKRVVSNKVGKAQQDAPQPAVKNGKVKEEASRSLGQGQPQQQSPSPVPVVLVVRSRSEGEIESLSVCKQRKEEMIGGISKQRLTRASSMVLAPNARICPYPESIRVPNKEAGSGKSIQQSGALTSVLSNSRLGAFFLINNLDSGKKFIANESNEQGMWNRPSDLQMGKQLAMEEFEKSVGYSPVVKELIRRENVSRIRYNDYDHNRHKFSANSYLSKSLRMSKRRGAALLKNIKGVANSMTSLKLDQKEKENSSPLPEEKQHQQQKQSKNASNNNQWVKVRQTGKSNKELSALHLCQEIQAHEGSIWTIRFSLDARFLASAGEDRTIHVWEVQECEVMSMNEGSLTPLHPSLCASPDHKSGNSEGPSITPEKKKKGKGSSTPDYVHVPETVFSLSEKPICSFKGHLDDVLDLSWSRSQLLLSSSMDKTVRLWDLETKSCVKLFAHNDYVTCIQFNPMDDNYFISGSLDAKVRIWSIPDRHVIDWTDLHEMVTAACYTPDGQIALIGSHKGSCRMYRIEDFKLLQLNQVDFQTKKKSNTRKITGFQFSPCNPSEVLVTSADSRIRILDGLDIVHKFRGFRNTSSQISASFSLDGKYVVCASEDSQVYVWKREEPRHVDKSGKKTSVHTSAHENFQCKDVSVAITWPGVVKGEPPPMPVNSKRHSKRLGAQPSSATDSLNKEDIPAHSKRMLPPLPKKNNRIDRVATPLEEDLAQVSRDPGIGESFTANSSSMRSGDPPSISADESNACSTRQDDPSSITASTSSNSSSIRRGDSSSPSWSSSWSWFENGHNKDASHTVQATAWGLVIVTATLEGEIRIYQNFGMPRRLGRL